jgi:hypothetical protein
MSYMRGEYYIWQSEGRTHFWAMDGYDGWDETGWGEDALTRPPRRLWLAGPAPSAPPILPSSVPPLSPRWMG